MKNVLPLKGEIFFGGDGLAQFTTFLCVHRVPGEEIHLNFKGKGYNK